MQSRERFAWRLLLLSLVCAVLEGAVRKWVVRDASVAGRLAYLSKDIVMAAFVAFGLGRSGILTKIAQPYLQGGIVLVLIGALTSSLSGIEPVGALLSIRTFFVYPIAAWFAGRSLPADSLRRLAFSIAVLSLPLAVLGALQFYSSPASRLNGYSAEGDMARQDVATASVSERVRATGTFSYISGYGEFAPVAVWAGIVTFSLSSTKWARYLGYAATVAGMCCAFTTVSRAVAIASIAVIGVWAAAGADYVRKTTAVASVTAIVFAALLLSGKWDAADEVVSTVYRRHQEASDSFAYRLWYQFVLPFEAVQIAPLGNGLGFEQIGRTFSGSFNRVQWTFESAWGRTVLELGVLGLLGFVATLGAIFVPLWSAYRTATSANSRTVLAATGTLLLLKAIVGFQFNHVAIYFFWSLAAAMLALGSASTSRKTIARAGSLRSREAVLGRH